MSKTKAFIPYLILAFILCLLAAYFYWETIGLPPAYIHAWTQSDRLAIALGYLDNDFNFWKPQLFNLVTKEGVSAVDFPIHEYLVALCMKLLGSQDPSIFRIYTLVFSFIGYFFLYRLALLLTASPLKSIGWVLFAFISPIIVYYQAGFIPSSTALASCYIGYYYYFKYLQSDRIATFYVAIFWIGLAALVRSPFHIYLFAILLQQAYRQIRQRKVVFAEWIGFALIYLAYFAYYLHRQYLQNEYGTQFLTVLKPASSLKELLELTQVVWLRWQGQFFSFAQYSFFILALLGLFFKASSVKLRQSLGIQTLLLLGGFAVYFGLMAKQFVDHEYYFMDSLYLGLFFGLLYALDGIPTQKVIYKLAFAVVFIGAIGWGSLQSKSVQALKYAETSWDRGEITRKNFIGAKIWLDSIGIAPEAKILVIDAYSTNAPLIDMGRKGYTVLITTKKNIQESLLLPFDYVVIQDQFLLSDVVFYYPEIVEKLQLIASNGKISIYKLSNKPLGQSFIDLLDLDSPLTTCTTNFEDSSSCWQNTHNKTDSIFFEGQFAGLINPKMEFGPTFNYSLTGQPVHKLLFSGQFYSNSENASIRVICSIGNQEGNRYYQEFTIKLADKEKWTAYQCLFVLAAETVAGDSIKCYIWNTDKTAYLFDNLTISLH